MLCRLVAVAVILGYVGVATALLFVGGLTSMHFLTRVGVAMYALIAIGAVAVETGPARRWRGRRAQADAATAGLDASVADRSGLSELPLAISDRKVDVFNVYYGEREGIEVYIYVCRVTEESWIRSAGELALTLADRAVPAPRKDYYRYAVARLDEPVPRVVLARQKRVRKLAQRGELKRVTSSAHRVGSVFELLAEDPVIGAGLVDAPLQDWLLAHDQEWNFELLDRCAASYLAPGADTVAVARDRARLPS